MPKNKQICLKSISIEIKEMTRFFLRNDLNLTPCHKLFEPRDATILGRTKAPILAYWTDIFKVLLTNAK